MQAPASKIKPPVAEQKKKKPPAAQQKILSATPVTEAVAPVAETEAHSNSNGREKAQDYLVDYLAKYAKPEPAIKAEPVSKDRNKNEPVAEVVAPVPETEAVPPGEKPGLQFINPALTDKVFTDKQAKAGRLAKKTSATKTAAKKIAESEKAQDKPEAEQHSDSSEGQVTSFAGQQVPEKSTAPSRNALHATMEAVLPKTLGNLRDFKKEGKGKQVSDAVMQQVSSDVGSVKQSFVGMGQKPAPAPAEKGEPLPAPEKAEYEQTINMGTGVVPPLEPEHVETQKYLNEADEIYKKEEVNHEDLEEVTSGELADAKTEMGNLKKDVVDAPIALQNQAKEEQEKVRSEMETGEKDTRKQMITYRGGKLKETGNKQKDTKTKLEKEREAVAKKINDKFEACQKSITGKLEELEKTSLKRFDDGQAAATRVFEEQVNTDIEAFKKKRYDTDPITLAIRKVDDWWSGIDRFKDVQDAFTSAKTIYTTTIDRLVADITTANNKVIGECKKQLQDTRKEIADYVSGLKGSLKKAGNDAMGEVTEKLNKLSEDIDKKKEELQKQLADKRQAAMKAIDDKIAKMKEKLGGMQKRIGKLVANFAMKVFKWACNSLGLDAESILSALRRAGQAFMSIIKNVRKFFGNLVDAVKGAIHNFRDNFKAYLTEALVAWLTGAMGNSIQMPQKFDLKGVFSIIMQMAGFSGAFIRNKLVAIFGEQKVAYAEQNMPVLMLLAKGDIMGIWDWIKDSAQNMMTTVVEGIKDWALTSLVKGFVEWIISLLIPGAGLVKAVKGIYKLVMWFVDNINRIIQWVTSVLDSLGSIAAGAIAAAIGFIVKAMKTIIPAILDFFAKLLDITGIVDAVKNIVSKVTAPIHKAIDKMVDWVKGMLKKGVDKVKGAFGKKEKPKEQIKGEHDTEVGKIITFESEGEQHRIWIAVKGNDVEVMVASDPSPVIRLLDQWYKEATDEKNKSKINKAKVIYSEIMTAAKDTKGKMNVARQSKDEKKTQEAEKADTKVEDKESELAKIMAELFKKFGKVNQLDAATIAEAQGKFQTITDKANKFIGRNLSKLIHYGLLTDTQVIAAYDALVIKQKGPWLYWAFYGTAIENYVDEKMDTSADFQSINKGGNYPDFEGRVGSKYEGFVFDITTINQSTIDSHVARTRHEKKAAHYNNVIITTYDRESEQKNSKIIKEMNQSINKFQKIDNV